MHLITLGVGTPSSIPAFMLFGLSTSSIELSAVNADVLRLPVRVTTLGLPSRRTIATADDSI